MTMPRSITVKGQTFPSLSAAAKAFGASLWLKMQPARKLSYQKALRVMHPLKHKLNLRMMPAENSLRTWIHPEKTVKNCMTMRLKIMERGIRISKNSPRRKICLLSGFVVKK